jgi:hypothetical protein
MVIVGFVMGINGIGDVNGIPMAVGYSLGMFPNCMVKKHCRSMSFLSHIWMNRIWSDGKWPIEIDGLPSKNGGSFHGYVSHNQMVFLFGTIMNNHGDRNTGEAPVIRPWIQPWIGLWFHDWLRREFRVDGWFGVLVGWYHISISIQDLISYWKHGICMNLLILSTPSLVFTIQFLISFIYYHLVI